ncbi:hypothetical protein HDU96_005556, partial [Phlyctochytrium bullatum]
MAIHTAKQHFIASPPPSAGAVASLAASMATGAAGYVDPNCGDFSDPAQEVKAFMDAAIGFPGSNLQIRVLGVPAVNARSRVETQVKL